MEERDLFEIMLKRVRACLRAQRNRGVVRITHSRPDTAILTLSSAGVRAAGGWAPIYSRTRLRRSALVTTLTEDSAIAAAAIMGESKMPKKG